MNRRLGLAILAGALCRPAFAQEDHSGHIHPAVVGGAAPNQKLVDTASDCVKAGEACIAHCLASFATGDTSLAACARSVDQMLSVCATLQKLASAGSPHLAGLAKVALAICDDCEAECRKHGDHHATCKACGEACHACAEECRRV